MRARRRVDVEAADEVPGGDAKQDGPKPAPRRSLRPAQCRAFAKRQVAEAFPEIVERFVQEAKRGSIPHAKALAMMGGLERAEAGEKAGAKKRAAARRRSLTEMLMERLNRGGETDLTDGKEA